MVKDIDPTPKPYTGSIAFKLTTEQKESIKLKAYTLARPLFFKSNEILSEGRPDSAAAFETIMAAGEQKSRFFHDSDHFFGVANKTEINNWIDAVRFRAAMNHDIVYHQVDVKGENKRSGIVPDVEKKIEPFIVRQGKAIYINPDPSLSDNILFQAALKFFNFDDKTRISKKIELNPFSGQNEFLSALYAIEQAKELGIPDKYILAEMVHIAGTVPFLEPNVFTSYRDRLALANKCLPQDKRLTVDEIERTMRSATDMANQDVVNFRENFKDKFLPNAYLIAVENVAGDKRNMSIPAYFLQASSGQANFLSHVGECSVNKTKSVFHGYKNDPAPNVLKEWESLARENINALVEYSRATSAAVVMMTALHMVHSPAAEPSADVQMDELFSRDYTLHPFVEGKLTTEGKVALDYAQHRIQGGCEPAYVSDNVAAYLFEMLGSEGIKELGMIADATSIHPQAAIEIKGIAGKPGVDRRQSAEDFLSEVERVFKKHHVDYARVTEELSNLLKSPRLQLSASTRIEAEVTKTAVDFDAAEKALLENHDKLAIPTNDPFTVITEKSFQQPMTSRVALETPRGKTQ